MGLAGGATTLHARVALLFPVQHLSSCSRGAPGTDGPDSTGGGDKGEENGRLMEGAVREGGQAEDWEKGTGALMFN